jgi:hypothetical protein
MLLLWSSYAVPVTFVQHIGSRSVHATRIRVFVFWTPNFSRSQALQKSMACAAHEITVLDVAEIAGVHPVTVSKYLTRYFGLDSAGTGAS